MVMYAEWGGQFIKKVYESSSSVSRPKQRMALPEGTIGNSRFQSGKYSQYVSCKISLFTNETCRIW